jgi:hypothetical protein
MLGIEWIIGKNNANAGNGLWEGKNQYIGYGQRSMIRVRCMVFIFHGACCGTNRFFHVLVVCI